LRLRKGFAPPAKDAASLAFGRATPDAVLDPMQQRVLETLDAHFAVLAHALRRLDPRAVGRKELRRSRAAASCPQHPCVLVERFVRRRSSRRGLNGGSGSLEWSLGHVHLPSDADYGALVAEVRQNADLHQTFRKLSADDTSVE
jgi:hypothetical protein